MLVTNCYKEQSHFKVPSQIRLPKAISELYVGLASVEPNCDELALRGTLFTSSLRPPRLRGAKAIHRRDAEKAEEAQSNHRFGCGPYCAAQSVDVFARRIIASHSPLKACGPFF
jgi:hypothetical protein